MSFRLRLVLSALILLGSIAWSQLDIAAAWEERYVVTWSVEARQGDWRFADLSAIRLLTAGGREVGGGASWDATRVERCADGGRSCPETLSGELDMPQRILRDGGEPRLAADLHLTESAELLHWDETTRLADRHVLLSDSVELPLRLGETRTVADVASADGLRRYLVTVRVTAP